MPLEHFAQYGFHAGECAIAHLRAIEGIDPLELLQVDHAQELASGQIERGLHEAEEAIDVIGLSLQIEGAERLKQFGCLLIEILPGQIGLLEATGDQQGMEDARLPDHEPVLFLDLVAELEIEAYHHALGVAQGLREFALAGRLQRKTAEITLDSLAHSLHPVQDQADQDPLVQDRQWQFCRMTDLGDEKGASCHTPGVFKPARNGRIALERIRKMTGEHLHDVLLDVIEARHQQRERHAEIETLECQLPGLSIGVSMKVCEQIPKAR